MFTAWVRKVFRGIIEPTARFLARLGFSANTLTILGALLTLADSLLIAKGYLRIAGVVLILSSSFDALDGTLARQTGGATRFGAFLDSVLDRVSEAAIFLAIAWWYMEQPGKTEEFLAYVTIVGSFLVSYARARAEGLGIDCKVGLFTRVERALVLILALLFNLIAPALWLLAIGTVTTAIHRALHVYNVTRQRLA